MTETNSKIRQQTDSPAAKLFVVTVQFRIKPDHCSEFIKEMLENASQSRRLEPGCLAFDVCEDPARSSQVFLYEVYQNAAAFEQHKKEAHFLSFDQKVSAWVMEKKVTILSLIDR